MVRLVQLPRTEHIVTSAVAGACVALALAEGGFAPTSYAAAALAVWIAVVIGLATGVVPPARPPVAAVVAGLCLGGFAALIALSMAWATDGGHAFEDVVRALAYLGAFVLVVVCSRRGEARSWLRGLAIGLGLVGAIALLARFEPDLFGHPEAEIATALPAALGRLTYPIGYWNGLAAAMAAAIALLVWFGANAATARARALAVGALPLVILALWATDSRGGIVAALLACVLLIAAGPGRSRLLASLGLGAVGGVGLVAIAQARAELFDTPGTALAAEQAELMLPLTLGVLLATALVRFALDRPIASLALPRSFARAAVVAAAVLAVVVVVAADPVERFEDFKQPPQGSELAEGQSDLLRSGGSGRYQFWETALDAFASAPVGGLGSSGYAPYWLEHREFPQIATKAHSLFFESLAELGIAGLALIGGFFGVAAVAGVRRIVAAEHSAEVAPALAVLGVGFAAAAVDWTWDLPAVFVPTVIAAALLTGPATLAGGAGDDRVFGTVRSRRRFAGGVAVLLVAWVSVCASGLLVLSDHSLQSSRERSAAGDLEGAISAANDAIDIQPWAAEPRTQLALLYERAGDLPAARQALGEAIDRAERDFELYLLAVRLDRADRDFAAAEANTRRAAELNPLDAEQLRE